MKFTQEEIAAIDQWRTAVTDEIAFVLGNELSSEKTTQEEDRDIARTIFNYLLAEGRLEMPQGKQPISAGGVIPFTEISTGLEV